MKYFFGFLISIALVVLVIVLVIRGFTGDSPKQQTTPLSSYAGTSKQVEFTASGPIVGEQQFKSYRITVGRDQTGIEIRNGYEANIVDQRSYTNNQESYTNFLRALDVAGYTKGVKDSPNKDERGMCADGERYVMQIKDGSRDVQRFWSSSCRGQGTFGGDTAEVRQLFVKQIPQAEFTKLTRGLGL